MPRPRVKVWAKQTHLESVREIVYVCVHLLTEIPATDVHLAAADMCMGSTIKYILPLVWLSKLITSLDCPCLWWTLVSLFTFISLQFYIAMKVTMHESLSDYRSLSRSVGSPSTNSPTNEVSVPATHRYKAQIPTCSLAH